jgi:hypothetical protein
VTTWHSADELPRASRQRRLHRRQMKAIRAQREREPQVEDAEDSQWGPRRVKQQLAKRKEEVKDD